MTLNVVSAEQLLFLEAKETYLRVVSRCCRSVTLRVYGFTKHGLFDFRHSTNSDRSVATSLHRLPEMPCAVDVGPLSPPLRRGECFGQVQLYMAGAPVYACASGYITDTRGLHWPAPHRKDATEGPGFLRSIAGTNPAAGAEVSETVPTNARWRLYGINFSLVTSADIGDRRVRLLVDDGTNMLMEFACLATQAASLTRYYKFHGNCESQTGFINASLYTRLFPPSPLFQGWRIRTATIGMFAADDYGAPRLLVEEWIEE